MKNRCVLIIWLPSVAAAISQGPVYLSPNEWNMNESGAIHRTSYALTIPSSGPCEGGEVVTGNTILYMKKLEKKAKPKHPSAVAPPNESFDLEQSQTVPPVVAEEFLVRLAHELRNSLAPIRSAVDLLHLRTLDPPLRSAITMIDRQTNHLGRIVDDLIDISQISDNTFALHRAISISIRSAIDLGIAAARAEIEAMEQTLFVDMPAEAAYMEGDSERIGQVIGDLLRNACRFTERGGRIWLSISYTNTEATIIIRDSGEGMSPEKLRGIFRMHAGGDSSLDSRVEGLGVSLHRAERIVGLHGGSIIAESPGLGKGSTFTILLPIHQKPPARNDSEKAYEDDAHAPLRVLVVDDNEDAAQGMGKIVGRLGHDVRTAYDGEEALELVELFRPNVVLLDIGMRGMNGYEVANHIRRHPWGGDVLLAATTGWGQEVDRTASRDSGFDYHLTKPIEVSTLTELLRAGARRMRIESMITESRLPSEQGPI